MNGNEINFLANTSIIDVWLSGAGQTAEVEVGEVEGDLSHAIPGEACDVSAQHLIRFESLNPFTYMQKTVEVCNKA